MLTLSENEIDQQKNTINPDTNDELFASFSAPKKLQPPPRVRKEQQEAAQINSFLNNLPETTQKPPVSLEHVQEDMPTQPETMVTTAAGWGDEEDMEINIE